MSDLDTRADSVHPLHTGAATPHAAQTDPDASLGGWPSATEFAQLAATTASLPANVTLDWVSGHCGPGTAYLDFPTNDTARFRAPGSSTYGAEVTIANGESKVIEDGEDAGMFVRISRTSTANLSGTATLTIADVYNNAVGFDNVSAAEATAGDDEYRAVAFKNENAIAIVNLKFWLSEIGTARVSDSAQLGASGAGTITTTGSFADWPDTGFCAIQTAAGALREIVYYSSRTATSLTVPAAGRGLLGTSAAAGASDDDILSVPGIRIDCEPATGVGAVTFTGSGLDDATSGGTATLKDARRYRVEIDGTGTPDTFRWSNDNGSTWEASTVAITGAAQTLENGVTITFAATTGHTSADRWDFTVGKAVVHTDEDTEGSGLSWSTPYASADAIDDGDGSLAEDELCYLHIHRHTPAGTAANPSVLHHIRYSFDSA